jgi:transketolase
MRDAFLSSLTELASTNRDVFLITADLGFKVLDAFRERHPKQFLNIGIAEQNMIGVAAGLALSGKIVFVYSIANFSTLRCLEQIRNDACYHNANVKIVSVGSGFSYGQLGISHHATEDIAIMRAIPDLTVYSPATDDEVDFCAKMMVQRPGAAYIRLDRQSVSLSLNHAERVSSKGSRVLSLGSKIALLATGSMVSVALEVSSLLATAGYPATVVSVYELTADMGELLHSILSTHEYLFTLEEHSIKGGLGGIVAEYVAEMPRSHVTFKRFGLQGGFSSIVGDQMFLREAYAIDANSIVSRIVSVLESE